MSLHQNQNPLLEWSNSNFQQKNSQCSLLSFCFQINKIIPLKLRQMQLEPTLYLIKLQKKNTVETNTKSSSQKVKS